jgi:carbonic anhydrase
MRLQHVAAVALLAAAAPAAAEQKPVTPFAGSHDATAAASSHGGAHWGYAGESGPEYWGVLSPEYRACAQGDQQSPIDIDTSASLGAEVAGIEVAWAPTPAEVVDNGHTIQVSVPGAGGVTLDGVRYDLLQFHFHHHSEHAIDGAYAPMEAHFVHKAADGRYLVLGAMIQEGRENPALSAIWSRLGDATGRSAAVGVLDFSSLAPSFEQGYRYQGSLTTPPCSEIVTWHVFAAPVTASRAQIQAFAARYPDNARPVLDVARRYVLRAE